ncbi:MAG TPA: 4-alpha-glucanotransferase [Polyangia bacterium]
MVVPERAPRPEAATVESTSPPARSRRAGVLIPLFSVRTNRSWGCGDIGDIPKFAAWAAKSGLSVLQLLPVNEVTGADASPYAAASAFALDPVYLSIDDCEDFAAAGGLRALPPEHREELESLRNSPIVQWPRVRRLKEAAAHLAFQRFLRDECKKKTRRAQALNAFQMEQRSWLDDHLLFSVIHERLKKSWLDWPEALRLRTPEGIAGLRREFSELLLEKAWLQWQLDLQWRKARDEASDLGVSLMGDLPFTVASDSADVWANPKVFRPDLHVGTPPDDFAAEGQDWGLPAYDWNQLRRSEFAWIRARAARASVLFSGYRVDHVIGLYRTYVRNTTDGQSSFWPAHEAAQIALGETLIRIMRTTAEVIAEDLGTVPPFLRPSLDRLSVPGYRVLRWEKDNGGFRDPATYPKLSVATNGTHDTDTTADWYDGLAADERALLTKVPGLETLADQPRFTDKVRDAVLAVLYRSPAQLVIEPFQHLLGHRDRVNVPGTVSDSNWSYRMPLTVEDLEKDAATSERLARLAQEYSRHR